ncbi:MAG: metal ABC transporter solute-binding protein, Zn/Mn family [Lactobacillus sp.]
MKKNWKVVVPLVAFCALFLTGCGSKKASQSSSKVNIVTSTNVYANIAKQVVGKYGTSTPVIKNGDTDPHDFEPTTASANTVSKANVVIANGLGYDSWMGKLASSSSKKAVRVGNDLLHFKNNSNPHIWYNLNMANVYVNYIVKRASKLDPAHAAAFKANAKRYMAKIANIKAVAKKINGTNEKPVFVSEPVFDYALLATGFKVGDKEFEEETENETDPSAKTIREIHETIAKKGYSLFVNNTQASSSTVNNLLKLAQKQNIPVLNVRETMPNGVSYYHWMYGNYSRLYKQFAK